MVAVDVAAGRSVAAADGSEVSARERPIGEEARAAGTTSRTLRHYDAIGLLPPSRTGPGGQHPYDEAALVRLQRVRLLRDLGLGPTETAKALDGERDADTAAFVRDAVRAYAERVR
ncbi:MerR family transcriptional regulator [Streptomyces sp. GSL17-111]|uniref:MerR family transcriptional regulator n=1 Tax=Streptomyces sp. GSL17-111 TaxID=3121596 RepID=UPI0040408CE2